MVHKSYAGKGEQEVVTCIAREEETMQTSEWSLCLRSAAKLTARGFCSSSACPAPAKNSGNQMGQVWFSWAS